MFQFLQSLYLTGFFSPHFVAILAFKTPPVVLPLSFGVMGYLTFQTGCTDLHSLHKHKPLKDLWKCLASLVSMLIKVYISFLLTLLFLLFILNEFFLALYAFSNVRCSLFWEIFFFLPFYCFLYVYVKFYTVHHTLRVKISYMFFICPCNTALNILYVPGPKSSCLQLLFFLSMQR